MSSHALIIRLVSFFLSAKVKPKLISTFFPFVLSFVLYAAKRVQSFVVGFKILVLRVYIVLVVWPRGLERSPGGGGGVAIVA